MFNQWDVENQQSQLFDKWSYRLKLTIIVAFIDWWDHNFNSYSSCISFVVVCQRYCTRNTSASMITWQWLPGSTIMFSLFRFGYIAIFILYVDSSRQLAKIPDTFDTLLGLTESTFTQEEVIVVTRRPSFLLRSNLRSCYNHSTSTSLRTYLSPWADAALT